MKGKVRSATPPAIELVAPAKLTLSLRVVGVRTDGYHLLEAEMVTLDLADTLHVAEADDAHVTVEWVDGSGDLRSGLGATGGLGTVSDDLVSRALAAVGRRAQVRLVKRIPVGAGLGGGSADAAAVLRWAGCRDPRVAASLGADVPFCVVGGRAVVRGIGDVVVPEPYLEQSYVLLLVPFGVETAAVYRAWDELGPAIRSAADDREPRNDLEEAALRVDPRLGRWRSAFEEATGRRPRLAGSGSSWFVEGTLESLGVGDPMLQVGRDAGRMVTVRTTPPP